MSEIVSHYDKTKPDHLPTLVVATAFGKMAAPKWVVESELRTSEMARVALNALTGDRVREHLVAIAHRASVGDWPLDSSEREVSRWWVDTILDALAPGEERPAQTSPAEEPPALQALREATTVIDSDGRSVPTAFGYVTLDLNERGRIVNAMINGTKYVFEPAAQTFPGDEVAVSSDGVMRITRYASGLVEEVRGEKVGGG